MSLLFGEKRLKRRDENAFVKGLFKFKIKFIGIFEVYCGRLTENRGKIYRVRSVRDPLFPHAKFFRVSHKFINCTDTEFCHYLAQFFRDKQHKVHHILGFSAESASEFGVLRRYTDGTGIKVADTHHHTAHRYKRRSCKSEFFGAEKTCYRDVSSAHQFSVRFEADA